MKSRYQGLLLNSIESLVPGTSFSNQENMLVGQSNQLGALIRTN